MTAEDKLGAICDALPRNVWAVRNIEEAFDYDTISYVESDTGLVELHCFTPDWYANSLEYRKLDMLRRIHQEGI